MITVSGKITDQSTGQALPYANVYFSNRTGQILSGHQGSSADENGDYTIEGDGAYITASYVGYPKQTKPFKRSLDFDLNSGVELREVEIISNIQKESESNAIILLVTVIGLAIFTIILIAKL